MSNDNQPAAASGGPGATSQAERLAADLPAKIRVHALAKLLGLTSKDVLAALAETGNEAKGPQSGIDRATALHVVAVLLPDPSEPGGDLEAEELDDGALGAPLAPIFAAPQPLFIEPGRVRAARVPIRVDVDVDPDDEVADDEYATEDGDDTDPDADDEAQDGSDESSGRRRRRRGRRGRGRGKVGQNGELDDDEFADGEGEPAAEQAEAEAEDDDADGEAEDGDEVDEPGGSRRRRRRRRRKAGQNGDPDTGDAVREDDPPDTVVHVREARPARAAAVVADTDDGVQGVRGSTRLEAKRQRRRDGREAGRRRPPILSEAEFLARRESVDRLMVVREHTRGGGPGLVQMGVLEDGVLVEHFVTSAGNGSLVGNVYLGRVQNVLPSMEAAFVDIGRGRNAVLYAGEVDWDAAGLEGKARKIEQALSSGDSVLVQVTKDPVGHKGARLTTQISLPGRFLVYVPGGGATGISRKLPDTERKRLKDILRRIVPDEAGVIIRTASEGVTEDSLARDVRRLQAQWEVIKSRSDVPRAQAPQLLYEEPDLLIKVVRDLFTEDFSTLVVQGRDAMGTIEAYVEHVAPDLAPRLRKHVGNIDVFTEYRIDEQLLKALDRKVWLPSGGYLVIDRTEAMTVIDVNTGKFTGSGGNLEETVTRNNLEAAEEIVRQLRLRDIGGIIVIDFIDMVLESNRDLVLRRLTECLGRDRTRHQVAEVTSLGLVQMTRKRVGSGLLEAFSAPCEHCRGRGVMVSTEPVEAKAAASPSAGNSNGDAGRSEPAGRRARSRGRSGAEPVVAAASEPAAPQQSAPPQAPQQPAPEPVAAQPLKADNVQSVPPAEPVAAPEPVPAEVPAAEVPAAVEAAPVKATRSRRRSAQRAATAQTVDETAATAADPAAVAQNHQPDPPAQPAAAMLAIEQADAEPAPAASTASRTRRRRAASRPAGPPAGGDVSQAG